MTRTIFTGIRELIALDDGPQEGAVRGEELGTAAIRRDCAILVKDGRIERIGKESDLLGSDPDLLRVDVGGQIVVPGFVDCHTHPVFGATREKEFQLRCQGADYAEIAKRGGGILSSVRSLRETAEEPLTRCVAARLERFLELGTTSIEAKSGYGLSTDSELKSLRALKAAATASPITVSPTFLGAHEVAPEYREDKAAYVRLLIDEMIPAARDLADSCDVFVEDHVFQIEEGRAILQAAKDSGYRLRVHADELAPLGGAELCAELGAASADHLLCISEAGIEALAASDTTAVLLPGTSFFLRKEGHAPARALIEAGAKVALATDFNPGSCYTQSLPMIVTLAQLQYGMTPIECLQAITRNAADSLGISGERGTLHEGKAADFVAMDLPSIDAFGYAFGDSPVTMTVKDGVVVY